MATLSLIVDKKLLLKQLKASQTAILRGVKKGVREAMIWGLREAKEGAPVSTGDLKRNSHAKAYDDKKGNVGFTLGVGVPGTKGKPLIYARIQDIGGLVKPKTAKKLAWPVHKKLRTKAARVSGIGARHVISKIKGGGYKGFTEYSFTDRAILGWRKIGAKGKTRSEVLFVRASQVYIQATKYLQIPKRDLENRRLRDFIADSISAEIKAGRATQ